MPTLLNNMAHLPKDMQILIALGEFYCLTIKQVMELCGWHSYEKTTELFRSIVYNKQVGRKVFEDNREKLIYRIFRHGLGSEFIKGDVYLLLRDGAKKLRESELNPTFSFEPKQAVKISGVPLEHTLLVNQVLIKLFQFQTAHPNRFRLEDVEHERIMRRKYEKVFELYPDGFVHPLVYTGKRWRDMHCFLELNHTSQFDKARWQKKVRRYMNLFEYNLQTHFDTQTAFVLAITTNPEYVAHHIHWTEEVLTDLRKEEYRTWFCIGSFDTTLSPVQFFCSKRFFNPFEKAPREVFDGLALSTNS